LLALILGKVSGKSEQMQVAVITGVLATLLINGSEVVWWLQPLNWVAYQMLYFVIYFVIAGALLCRLLPDDNPAANSSE
jgi:hypothetical protein